MGYHNRGEQVHYKSPVLGTVLVFVSEVFEISLTSIYSLLSFSLQVYAVLLVNMNGVRRKFTEDVDRYFGVQVGAGVRKRKNGKGVVMRYYLKYLPELRGGVMVDI